jgi:hypothetical protein
MFPIIISSNLGKNQKVQKPKIETLQNYIHITNEEFEKHFRKNLDTNNNIGIFTATDLIRSFYNFDIVSDKEKRNVIEFVENPEYGSFKYYLKNLFKIK